MLNRWSVLDFFLIVVGGFIVGIVAAVMATFLIEDEGLVLIIAIVAQNAAHLITFWVLREQKADPEVGLGFDAKDPLYLFAGVLLQIGLVLLFAPLALRLLPEGEPAQEISSVLLDLSSPGLKIAAALVLVALVPFTEEIMYRGVLMRSIYTDKKWILITVTALVFALAHSLGLDPDRFWASAAVVLPQEFLAGVALAWMTLSTGRLWPAIFTHAGFNLLAAVVLFLPSEWLDSVNEALIAFS